MASSIDTASAKLLCLLIRQIPAVTLVEDSICESAPGANGEKVALQPSTIGVDVEDRRALQYIQIYQHTAAPGRIARIRVRTVLSQPQIIVP